MPYNDPDQTDPMTLTGVEIVVDDPDVVHEMAVCFVEEFVRLGYGAAAIFKLFTSDEFAGPALAMRRLGPEVIRAMIGEQMAVWGPRASQVAVETTVVGVSLPVLQFDQD